MAWADIYAFFTEPIKKFASNRFLSMVEATLCGLVLVLIKLASGTYHYLRDFIRCVGVHKLLEEWKKTLKENLKALEDAEVKQHTNNEVRSWLGDLHNLVNDIGNFEDDLATDQARRINRSRASTSWFPNCGINHVSFKFILKMKPKIDDISRRLQDISQRRGTLRLIQSNNSAQEMVETVSMPQQLESSIPPTRVFGREKEKNEIVEMLMKPKADSTEIPVITILGMEGMGKTTLAQDVYNDNEVKGCFDLRAWVCVSDVFDASGITRAILKEIPGADNTEKLELNQLQVKLKEMLPGKKFLLVLDDIRNEDYFKWEHLLRPFCFGAAESRILATTRNESVASTMSLTGPRYHLKKLEDDDCLSLLALHALGRENFDLHPDLKESGKKIVKKCGHLPLAIKKVAALLRTSYNKPQLQCEWKDVINNNKWAKASDCIIRALEVSYNHLPSHLKRCFAYCSIIPKYYNFDRNDLVFLWMAEGLLEQPAGGMEGLLEQPAGGMEDFGRNCFQELLSRSFFQLTGGSESEFIMHDIINDLAVYVAGEACFRIDETWDGNRKYEISIRTRYLSFFKQNYELSLDVFNKALRSRTFLALKCDGFGVVPDRNTILRLQSLRVLNLEGCNFVELPNPDGAVELPNLDGAMKHLRYLNLSRTTIERLPEFVCSLYNLQTLSLNGCHDLCELPSRIGCLTNLRHLGLEDTPKLEKMPSGIGKLTSLQTLSKIIAGRDTRTSNLKDLKGLIHLHGTLSIELHNVTNDQDAEDADLSSKEHLEVLKLQWKYSTESADSSRDIQLENRVLEKLKPHCNLKVLEIEGYGGTNFPKWVRDLSHLRNLKIKHCSSLVWDANYWLQESLIKLELWECPKSVLSTLKNIQNLTSLPELSIKYLPLDEEVSEDE